MLVTSSNPPRTWKSTNKTEKWALKENVNGARMWRSISYIRMHHFPLAELSTLLQLCEITEGSVAIKPGCQKESPSGSLREAGKVSDFRAFTLTPSLKDFVGLVNPKSSMRPWLAAVSLQASPWVQDQMAVLTTFLKDLISRIQEIWRLLFCFAF